MDDWDKAARGVVGGFDGAAAKTLDDERGNLRNTLYDALLSNPEVSARAVHLGRQSGLEPDLVERNLPEVERSTRLDQLDALPKENPVLASWLAGTANARLAHDDLDNLGQFTNLLRPPPVPKLTEKYGFAQASRDLVTAQKRSASAASQYLTRNLPTSEIMARERTTLEGITEPVQRGVARARRGLTLLMGMGGMYEGDEAGLMTRLAQQNRKVESYPVPESVQQGQKEISDAEGFGAAAWEIITNPGAVKETVLESLGASAPSLLGAAGLSVFGPGGTAAGAGLGSFVVEYSSTIQSVLDENGVNASDPMALSKALNNPDMMDAAREKALARGVPIAVFDAITAGFAGKLLMGAKPTAGSAAARTGGELALQAGGGAAGEATAQFNTDEFKPGDILLEAIAELPTGLVEVPANYRASIDRATRAEEQTKTIEQLNQLVASSKVLQRDPETFQTFIEAATEDGPVDTVFVDGRMLMQSGMAPRLAEMSPAVREQLEKSILTGGDIAIPVAEYAARIAPTDLAPQLLDHLKTEPDGFTRAEAQDFMANQGGELQAEVERILTDRADADTFRASQDVVKQDILGQLNTAGRFTPQVNEAYATLASAYSAVRAAQLGMTPEAFHAERGMRVQGAAVAGQQFSQGSADRITVENDRLLLDGADIGMAEVLPKTRAARGGNGIEVARLYIDPEHQRQGIGGTLVDNLFAQHPDAEFIDVYPSGKSEPFWLRQGPADVDAEGYFRFTRESRAARPQPTNAFDPADHNILNQSSADEPFGMHYSTDMGDIILTESAKNPGQYQLTMYDGKLGQSNPVRDEQFKTKAEAIKEFEDAVRDGGGDLNVLNQSAPVGPRAGFSPSTNTIALLKSADLTSFLHESAHYFFESDIQLASELLGKARGTERKPLTDAAAPVADGYVRLYRAESPTVSFDDVFEREGLGHFARPEGMRGQRYTDYKKVADYYRSSYGNDAKIYYVDVLADRLDSLRVADSEYIVEPTDATSADLTPGEQQIVDDVGRLLTWHGIQGDVTEQLRQWHTMDFEEQRSHHERTAESFEAYLFSGKAPNLELQPIFQRFASWLVNVYKSLKDFLARNPEAGKLNDEVRAVFDRMIATQEEIALAEQARSMLPLFGNPEQSGMTPEAFAAYQAQGKEATATAIEELQAKGLRDLQWLANAKGRQVARLKRESKALRAEVELEARREVLSQPVYQAWGFLTRKMGQADELPALERKSDSNVLDPTLDSLFVAIAKLGGIRKDQVLSEWGVDPKDMPQSGLFGKPVWRLTDGLTLDGMAEALAEHGYLPLDENGKYELNDLGDRFLEELAGNTQYSHAYQPQDLQQGEQISNPAGLGAGRLDLAGLAAIDASDETVNALKARRMTAKNGLHPDLVAQMFDFSSGDEMVGALAGVAPPKEAITELADQMMLERHGELATPEAIEQAADAAIHNDARARFVATEYNALAQATGKPKILAAAAREYAAQMIARLKVRDIRPSQYANAETRAAKAAEKASKAGDLAIAAAEKRNQLVNLHATRAAYHAKDEVQAGVRYLRKFDKRSKSLDADYQDQIEVMLERFDLKPVSLRAVDKRKSLAAWIEAQREAGLEPDISPELENEANRKSYKDMTVDEFRALVDTIKQIEHMGRLKHKLLTAQDQRDFGVIVDEVAGSIVENGGKARPVQLETPKGIRPWLEGFAAGHRKLASLIRQMDGLKDGGPFWRVLVRGMNESATSEAVMNEQATVALAELYKPILDMKGGINGDKQFIPEINDSLTRGGRLSVALNWGNATNRARIMDGDGWSAAQVQAILNRLTRSEWDFVNSMWAYIDSYWPQIEAKEKRVTGRAPEKVKAEPFTISVNGETVSLTGGYYPIKYDSNRDDRAEKLEASEVASDMLRGAFTRSTTRRGHTKERVEGVKRPVKKTLDVITQHVREVTHDLAWHEWLIDANRLLNAKPINQAIREHYGTEVIRTMKDALIGIATADIIPQTKIDTALLYLRANVSRSTMGMSLTTAFLQPFGLAQSMVRIGSKHVLRGMARWAGDAARFESSLTWIGEKSDFMRLRNKTFNRELHEIKGRVSKGHSKARTIYDASLFMLMQKMQMVADVPTWIGAYEKALADNQDDATAVALADQSVLDSQGGGQTKDMAEFQRKHPFLTMFYSYFNTTLNLAVESTASTSFKNPLAVAGWASDMALLMIIPALAPAMLLALMRGEDCEGEECAKKLAQAQAGYLLGTMLGVREMSGSVAGYDYAGPPVGRVVNELSRFGTQVGQGEADEGAAMSAVSLLGVSLGIPTTQILRSWRGWNAWEEGDAPVSSILIGPPKKD